MWKLPSSDGYFHRRCQKMITFIESFSYKVCIVNIAIGHVGIICGQICMAYYFGSIDGKTRQHLSEILEETSFIASFYLISLGNFSKFHQIFTFVNFFVNTFHFNAHFPLHIACEVFLNGNFENVQFNI